MNTTNTYSNEQITEAGHDESSADMVRALCAHLDCEPSDLKEDGDSYGLCTFTYGRQEYAIGTDEQADEACKEYVKGSIWAFNASFILEQCELPRELEEAITAFQGDKCESANDALLALVEKCSSLDDFTEAAVSADGRGHFLSGYDGNENEEEVNGETFYIYRTN